MHSPRMIRVHSKWWWMSTMWYVLINFRPWIIWWCPTSSFLFLHTFIQYLKMFLCSQMLKLIFKTLCICFLHDLIEDFHLNIMWLSWLSCLFMWKIGLWLECTVLSSWWLFVFFKFGSFFFLLLSHF